MNETALKTQEIVKAGEQQIVEYTPNALIALALEKDLDLDRLNQLMDLQERHAKLEAEKAFNRDMAKLKTDPPQILKDASVGYEGKTGGTVSYTYATLGNVTNELIKSLSKYNFTHNWTHVQDEKGRIEVTCTLTHIEGHSKSTSLMASPDATGSKNPIQAIGSTVQYLKRYTLLSISGFAINENENDGSPPSECISEEQVVTVKEWIETSGANEKKFLKYMGVESIGQITIDKYGKAIKALQAKGKKQ